MIGKSPLLLAAMVAAVAVTGCSSQQPAAEKGLKAAEEAVATARPEAEQFAPAELEAAESALDSARADFERHDYAEALADAEDALQKATALPGVVAVKKQEFSAAWTAANDSVPMMLTEIEAQLARLSSMRKLPADMSPSEVEEANSTLQTIKGTWTEAVQAYGDGRLADAVNKASMVKARATEVMKVLSKRRA